MSKWPEPYNGTVRLLDNRIVQAPISNISDDGKSGIADVDGKKLPVQWFYDSNAITPDPITLMPTITGSGMWYVQIQ